MNLSQWYARGAWQRHLRLLPVFAVALSLLLLAGGCASSLGASGTSPTRHYTDEPGAKSSGAALTELTAAQRMIRSGNYSMVIPKLQHIIQSYPETNAGVEARYFLGLSYYQIGGFRDALNYFSEYRAAAPEGKYAELCQEYIDGLTEQAGGEVDDAQVRARIQAAQERVQLMPETFAHQLELADLYWKDGQYDKAGEIYRGILDHWPQLETDATIRTRIERGPDGRYIVLTPSEVARRYAEADPLVIINTRWYRSGSHRGWTSSSGRDYFYHVSGYATNRGSDTLRNVRVHVTLYGFGSLVYEVKTVSIGQLRPGEERAFSVRFDNFDNIENIDRYECVGEFDR